MKRHKPNQRLNWPPPSESDAGVRRKERLDHLNFVQTYCEKCGEHAIFQLVSLVRLDHTRKLMCPRCDKSKGRGVDPGF